VLGFAESTYASASGTNVVIVPGLGVSAVDGPIGDVFMLVGSGVAVRVFVVVGSGVAFAVVGDGAAVALRVAVAASVGRGRVAVGFVVGLVIAVRARVAVCAAVAVPIGARVAAVV
jgi:hypothetical protein